MSFALTTAQIRARTKTVTRRTGWTFLKPGDLVQPVVKAQGLKKGERVEKIGAPVRIVAVDRVRLGSITPQDVHREGFPGWTTREFVALFKSANPGTRVDSIVTRIQFEYEA